MQNEEITQEITIGDLAVMINAGFKEAHQNLIDEVSLLATKEEVAELRADVSEMKGDIAVLKDDVAVLKDDVSVLKSDVSVLKNEMFMTKRDVSTMKKEISKLATKEEISKFATKDDLLGYVTKAEFKEGLVDVKKEIWESAHFVTNKWLSGYNLLDARVTAIESKIGLKPA